MCNFWPTPAPGQLWVEIVGPTCTPWSIMGARRGWLDANNNALLVWMAQVRALKPHAWLLECTPKIDVATITGYLRNTYNVEPFIFSPTQLGLPISGQR
eukprot:6546519-Alexandrium_andersonii.AAC.1